ncbi:MAG: hypothetical protein AVDCRST_MAG91-3442 [uncultured Sphingomonadaceae bacterium]|uniref:Thioesterase domain-containing protein n=1 Tax=uncultured Sphingomonadaceae bacterium TaxID=169976 RepID=A0A6J4U201_9SPHN|nr:MAG: hypothetical protein AVDCRST_MAG91-3442 [uncultured Sphingomonadaceae bacterium]
MPDIHYGVTPPEVAAELTGLELLRGAMHGLYPGAPIAEGLNFRLAEVEEGRVVFEGEPGPQHLNPLGSVHGGWVLTLVDSACGCAAHTVLGAGVGYTTVETKANFTRALRPDAGVVRTEGTVLSRGRTIITTEARVTDADGRLLAHGTSTLLVLK